MKFTIISANDWEGIYGEDGKLIDQNHRIDFETVLEKLGHKIESKYIEDDLDEFGNSLPNNLSEILSYINRKK